MTELTQEQKRQQVYDNLPKPDEIVTKAKKEELTNLAEKIVTRSRGVYERLADK